MNTKICSCCGKELPESEFNNIHKKNGKVEPLTICKDCMNAKKIEGRKKAKENRQKAIEDAIESAKKMRLQDFQPVELITELADRGYQGKLEYVRTEVIDITKFKRK